MVSLLHGMCRCLDSVFCTTFSLPTLDHLLSKALDLCQTAQTHGTKLLNSHGLT